MVVARRCRGMTTMARLARFAALLGWMALLAGVLLGALALDRGALAGPALTEPGTWGEWLAAREPADASMAVLRLVLVAIAAYLLVTTAAAVVLRVGDAGRLVSVADVITLPFVRGVVTAGLGIGFAGASVAAVGAGGAASRVPTAAEVALVAESSVPVLERVDAPPVLRELPPLPAPAPVPVVPVAPPATVAQPTGATWTVGAGDHLWSIAERVLASAWGRSPADHEVAPFWRDLVERNRDGLADPANPDLLFPGQVLSLPTPPPAGPGAVYDDIG